MSILSLTRLELLLLSIAVVVSFFWIFSILCKISLSAFFEVKNFYKNKKGKCDEQNGGD